MLQQVNIWKKKKF